MSNIPKRPYPWPGTAAMRGKDLDRMIKRSNRQTFTEGRVLQHDSGLSTTISLQPELVLQFAVLMTQAEIDADNVLQGGETAGLAQRQSYSSEQQALVDDDMLSAWCYIATIEPGTNARSRRTHEPVLVYFPLFNLVDNESLGSGCVAIPPGESFAIVWNHADARWECLRPRQEGDTMDVVMVCDGSKPVEDCVSDPPGGGDTEGQFCCLFDGMAFRLHPDCENQGSYFCSPDNSVFSIWIYAPDKRALPPEGVCDWGRRVQDAYTVSHWKPFGNDGPELSETRPVYQVAACACSCPRSKVDNLKLWCSEDPGNPVSSGEFELRAEPLDPPQEGVTQWIGEFSMTYTVPTLLSGVYHSAANPPADPLDIGFVSWDQETGEPDKFWYNDGNGDPDGPTDLPADFNTHWSIDPGLQCVPLWQYTESGDELFQTCTFWYRIKFLCTDVTGGDDFLYSVSNVQIYLIEPPDHYSHPVTVPAAECPTIGGTESAIDMRHCMGRAMGTWDDSDMGAGGIAPQYGEDDGNLPRFTPWLNHHRLLACGNVSYDENDNPTAMCGCDDLQCPVSPVYFLMEFNCNMANPL